jgi:Right handed beta helix region
MRGGGLAAALIATAALFAAPAAHAFEFDVNTKKDLLDVDPGDGLCEADNGKCALRAAIQEANEQPGADNVNLPKGTFELTKPRSGTPGIAEGDLDLLDTIAITGRTKRKTIIEQTARDRVFLSSTPAGAFLRDLTVTGGDLRQEVHGGGILLEDGPLLLEDAIVKKNMFTMQTNTFGLGGGIGVLDGELTMDNATVTKNRAHGDFSTASAAGGGVFLHFDASATIANSKIVKNGATTVGFSDTEGGGLYLQGPTTMTNTTVAGNRADVGGGLATNSFAGLDAEATTVSGNQARHGAGLSVDSIAAVEFTNSTFSGNRLVPDSDDQLGTGSAIYIGTRGFVRLTHVTIGENVTGPGQAAIMLEDLEAPPGDVSMDILYSVVADRRDECQGEPLIDEVHVNVLEDASCTGGGITTNFIGDPKLKPLALNPGPAPGKVTKTHALKGSSPAIDFVTTGCPPPATDQRGFSRPQGDGFCDAGSFEAPG